MIKAEYIGAYAMSVGGRVYDATQHTTIGKTKVNKTGVAPIVARKLIEEGADPEQVFCPTRDGRPVFKNRKLKWWAGRSITEGNSGIRFSRWQSAPKFWKDQP